MGATKTALYSKAAREWWILSHPVFQRGRPSPRRLEQLVQGLCKQLPEHWTWDPSAEPGARARGPCASESSEPGALEAQADVHKAPSQECHIPVRGCPAG